MAIQKKLTNQIHSTSKWQNKNKKFLTPVISPALFSPRCEVFASKKFRLLGGLDKYKNEYSNPSSLLETDYVAEDQ